MFATRRTSEPDLYHHSGIMVWVENRKGSIYVVVRQAGPKKKLLRLVETHSGESGGEFRFELAEE